MTRPPAEQALRATAEVALFDSTSPSLLKCGRRRKEDVFDDFPHMFCLSRHGTRGGRRPRQSCFQTTGLDDSGGLAPGHDSNAGPREWRPRRSVLRAGAASSNLAVRCVAVRRRHARHASLGESAVARLLRSVAPCGVTPRGARSSAAVEQYGPARPRHSTPPLPDLARSPGPSPWGSRSTERSSSGGSQAWV